MRESVWNQLPFVFQWGHIPLLTVIILNYYLYDFNSTYILHYDNIINNQVIVTYLISNIIGGGIAP